MDYQAPKSAGHYTDVLIAGGGPAGICAGILLARRGLKTVVLEKRSYPVNKVCGQGIMPTGVAHIRAIGIGRYLPDACRRPFAGISYHSRAGDTVSADF